MGAGWLVPDAGSSSETFWTSAAHAVAATARRLLADVEVGDTAQASGTRRKLECLRPYRPDTQPLLVPARRRVQ